MNASLSSIFCPRALVIDSARAPLDSGEKFGHVSTVLDPRMPWRCARRRWTAMNIYGSLVWKDGRTILLCGEKSVNPLRDEASLKRSGKKKKTHFVGLFFLTGLRPVLTHQNCGNTLKSLNQLQVDIAIVRREKAHVHIVNVRRNCKRKSLEFLV